MKKLAFKEAYFDPLVLVMGPDRHLSQVSTVTTSVGPQNITQSP